MSGTIALQQRLLNAPSQLLDALSKGEDALLVFEKLWEVLGAELPQLVQATPHDNEISHYAYSTASQISTLVESISALNHNSDCITISLLSEAQCALRQFTLDEACAQEPSQMSHRNSSALSPLSSVSPPPYVEPAYSWLMDNLHNPYPPLHVKKALAARTDMSVRDISKWFKEVRRSIGWVDICITYFQGSRPLAIEAATQVLIEEHLNRSPSMEVQVEFLSLQGRASCLYFNNDGEAQLSHSSNPSSRRSSMTPALESCRESSPERSELANTPVLGGTNSTPPLCKSNGVVDQPEWQVRCAENCARSYHLLTAVIRNHITADILPGCTPDTLSLADVPGVSSPPCSSESKTVSDMPSFVPEATGIRSRKRRLSDAGVQPPVKRTRGLPVRPRLQAVSDPLPRSMALDVECLTPEWIAGFSVAPVAEIVSHPDSSDPVIMQARTSDASAYENATPEMKEFIHAMVHSSTESATTPIPLVSSMEHMESLEEELFVPAIDIHASDTYARKLVMSPLQSQSADLPPNSQLPLPLDGTLVPDDLLRSFASSPSFSGGSSAASSTPPMTPSLPTPADATSSCISSSNLDAPDFREPLAQTHADPNIFDCNPEVDSTFSEYIDWNVYGEDDALPQTPSKQKASSTFHITYPLHVCDRNPYPWLNRFRGATGFAPQFLAITA
ncbi:unnamed protein product [Somion occarium]|uniref:KN homeodomain domain-containing protein n=1 Tax=Somion occarium TaxID=3059160 RepID=A0ABP1CH31_9APHY